MVLVEFMTLDDFEKYYLLKSELTSIEWGGFECAPSREKLYSYYSQLLQSGSKELFKICDNSVMVGYIQLECIDQEYEVGVGVFEEYRGCGYATIGLKNVISNFGRENFIAWIREDNLPSQKAFIAAGFFKSGERKQFYVQSMRAYIYMDKYICLKSKEDV